MARVLLTFSDDDFGRLLHWSSERIRLRCSILASCRVFSQGRHQGEASGGCRWSGWEVTVLMEGEAC